MTTTRRMSLVARIKERAQEEWKRIVEAPERLSALEHARKFSGSECAENIVFREGKCDVCKGECFCWDEEFLVTRLLTGLKPVGSFVFRTQEEATATKLALENKGLSVWLGKNQRGLWIGVASLEPDKVYNYKDQRITPRNHAFTQRFIDEHDEWEIRGILYGYRLP